MKSEGTTGDLGIEEDTVLPAKVQPTIKFSLNTYYVPPSNHHICKELLVYLGS